MKHLTLTIISVMILASNVFAAVYNIGPGDDFGGLVLRDYDTLLITGGTGSDIDFGGWSTGIIEDTDPINLGQGDGGIWEMTVSGHSELTINDGEFYEIVSDDFSTLNLHGGQIFGSLMVEHTTAWVHIYGHGFNNDPFGGSPLTGFWADDTPFSINLVDSTISTYDQIVFHDTPEPGTLALLGLGGILLRKRK